MIKQFSASLALLLLFFDLYSQGANQSVLANGNWVKIAVQEDGVYKLDYNWFVSQGFDPGSIDPRTIQVYGNGGAMLPQRAGDTRVDDLHENAIEVVGEGDGSFNSGDYVLFYGESPHRWQWFDSDNVYVHRFNIYSDQNYYFVTYGQRQGRRIQYKASANGVSETPSTTIDYVFHEQDEYNGLQSGRAWLGETFDLTTVKQFQLPVDGIAPNTTAEMFVRVAARASGEANSNFLVSQNGSNILNMSVDFVNLNSYPVFAYRHEEAKAWIHASTISNETIDLEFNYQKPNSNSRGWLDYIELNYVKTLLVHRPEKGFFFTATHGIGPGEVFQYNIENGGVGFKIWEVTDGINVGGNSFATSGSRMSFAVEVEKRKRFYAFDSRAFKTPVSASAIENQDLHGLPQAEFLIVTSDELKTQADILADFHRDELGQSVHVVTTREIFNEFGGGKQDPSAIRDFVKLFYDRAPSKGTPPEYLLLFGDGSYDYKNRIDGDPNHVTTYQSRKSQYPTKSYTSDDFFGFLDDHEGFWGEAAAYESSGQNRLWSVENDKTTETDTLDIGIGRMPVSNIEQAEIAIQKIKDYVSNPESYGPWRNKIVLVADHKDADGTTHIYHANTYDGLISQSNQCYDIEKVYMDNYEMTNTASGTRFVDGKKELISKMNEGSLIVNYSGHGGETGWSNSKILELEDIAGLENGLKMPVVVTATCEFGRWDDPARKSGAEYLYLLENGGAIAMLTTVRVVYADPNFRLNKNLYREMFLYDNDKNRWPRLGDVFKKTKNRSWNGGINNRNFTLMGDPAIPLNYPEHSAVITNINNEPVVAGDIDTLASLSVVRVQGQIEDAQGMPMPGYSGTMHSTVYDKPVRFRTLRKPFSFLSQKNRLFKGTSSIENGNFDFEFVVPIDISYEDGEAKISLYFENGAEDGHGCTKDIYFGGTGGIVDDDPPGLQLYMNDTKFRDGGMVGPNSSLYAVVWDDNGINTSGVGIGHELTAILDQDESNTIILNEYYSSNMDDYTQGVINFPFQNLLPGEHTLTVKVWDVANNSAEATITFEVEEQKEIVLGKVMNFPNPFGSSQTETSFFVEHNFNGAELEAEVEIFNSAGQCIQKLAKAFTAEGNTFCELTWDGKNGYGNDVAGGVYIYAVTLREPESGKSVRGHGRAVVLR